MNRRIIGKASGFITRQPDPDLGTTTPHCFDREDGKHFCMAQRTLVVSKGGLIVMMIENAQQGLFIEMTRDGIRQYCADLLSVAARVEAEHVAASNEQLAAALARKGDPA